MSFHKRIEKFINWIEVNDEPIILAMHEQADPDAVGSVIALIQLIKHINPNLYVSVHKPDLSQLSKQLLLHLEYDLPEKEHKEQLNPLILLDNPLIPKELNQDDRKIVIIDHHVEQEPQSPLFVDLRTQTATSTAEILIRIIRTGKIPLERIIVKSLLAGIIFDTRRFRYTNSDLFDNVSYLLQAFPDSYDEILSIFTSSRPLSERIACIKATQRMKRVEIRNHQILFSHVSSFEAAAARAFIFLGGDIAIIIARQSNHTRLSLRASANIIKKTNISLGRDIVPLLINEYGGTGGGHDGAAGYNIPIRMDMKIIFDFILKNLRKLLE